MKRLLIIAVAPVLVSIAGCGGWLNVEGLDAEEVAPPPAIESGTRYTYHNNVVVYEGSDHQYYRQYNGKWVRYRERPKDLGEAQPAQAHEGDHHEEPKQGEGDHHEEHR